MLSRTPGLLVAIAGCAVTAALAGCTAVPPTDDAGTPGDPCAAAINPCHPDAICTTVDGEARCACPEGFEGDGRECRPAAWMAQLGTAADDSALAATVGPDGDIYVAGATRGALEGFESAGDRDALVARLTAGGVLVWARQLGSAGDDMATGVAVSAAGEVFVAGNTDGDLGGDDPIGQGDMFVARLTADGDLERVQLVGTPYADRANRVVVDGTGALFLAGYTGGELGTDPHQGLLDAVVARLDRDGAVVWSRQLGTSSYDEARGLAVDAAGQVVIAGYTWGDLAEACAGQSDLFAASFDPDGAEHWRWQSGTAEVEEVMAIAVVEDGGIALAGYTMGSLDGTTPADTSNAFLLLLDAAGAERWRRTIASDGLDFGTGAAAVDGAVLVAGRTDGAIGDASGGDQDIFWVRFALDGSPGERHQLGQAGRDEASDLAAVAGGALVAGATEGTLPGCASAGGRDVALLRLVVP